MTFFDRIAGTWRATETLHASPWNPAPAAAEATLSARPAAGGALVMEYRRGDYEGLGVLRLEGQGYELWWFDAIEPPGPAKGRGVGDRLVLEREGPIGKARYTYDFVRDGEFTFRIERAPDGKAWRTFLDARYLRAGPPPPASRDNARVS